VSTIKTMVFVGGILTMASTTVPAAKAGYITTQSVGVNTIYSQTAFGEVPIDIRFNAGLSFVRPDLLSIDTPAEQAELWALGPDPYPTIDAFYVDSISYCSGPAQPGLTLIGCALLPGHELYLNSLFASLYPSLLGHELGHNLGLQHVGDFNSTGNLMNPLLNSDTLTVAQINTVFSSPLVQTDLVTGERFISVTPIAIEAVETLSIAEPSTMAILGTGLIFVGLIKARRRSWGIIQGSPPAFPKPHKRGDTRRRRGFAPFQDAQRS
jgi:hypothetical protein